MIWLWVAVTMTLLAVAALVPVLAGRWGRRSHRLRGNDEAVAARSRYLMLGHYVEDGAEQVDDEQAAALLRSARERWHTAGATLADARTEADFELARRIAVAGLEAVTMAYARLGRPGPRLSDITEN